MLEAKAPPYLQWGIGVMILGGLIFGLFQYDPTLTEDVQQLALLVFTPTPTETATPTLTATPTSTFTPTPTATFTPSATPSASATATPSPTITFTPSPEPTETPFGNPTATNTPLPTATPTPRFGVPVLLGPADGKLFGRQDEVVLRWENMGPLEPNETYAVRLTWQENGQLSFGGHNLKDNIWVVPPELYWGLADEFTGRKYEWFVFIEEIVTDQAGNQVGRPVSQTSERFTFLWQE